MLLYQKNNQHNIIKIFYFENFFQDYFFIFFIKFLGIHGEYAPGVFFRDHYVFGTKNFSGEKEP